MMTDREKNIHRAYQHGERLHIREHFYRDWLRRFIGFLFSDDFGQGDLTSEALISETAISQGIIIAKSAGILAGMEESRYILQSSGLRIIDFKPDRFSFSPGDVLMRIEGKARTILAYERTILNFLQRMSGIATLTAKYVATIGSESPGIAATRKTLWSFADKKAVYIGGGFTHRLGLFDAVLIKENHLSAIGGDSVEAIHVCFQKLRGIQGKIAFIEIEVKNMPEFEAAFHELKKLSRTVGIIMFDHFTPDQIARAIQSQQNNLPENILFEASGNINPDILDKYTQSGVDMLSVGAITHSAPGADFSLLLE